MKAVLISIRPKWCELIASGKKTVEVRKTRPKIETPFKVYIYMTMGKCPKFVYNENLEKQSIYEREPNTANGKVIGEFVCDKIYDIKPHFDKPDFCNQYLCDWKWGEGNACLSFTEMNDYLKGKNGYGFHISDLVIYDKPRSIVELCHPCDRDPQCDCNYCKRYGGGKPIFRAPQSWCYVEELQK